MVEIVIPVGTNDRAKPGAIVGAIAGESGLPGKVVGRINMRERVTFVEVPAEHAQAIIDAMSGVRIAGRVIHARLAHDGGRQGDGGGRPRRPYRKGPYKKKPRRGDRRG